MGTPVLSVEQVLEHIAAIAGDQGEYKLFVPATLAFEGKAIAAQAAMQLILVPLMDLGFSYRSCRPMGAGRVFRYSRWFVMPRVPATPA